MLIRLVSCFMLLIKFLFHVQIMELEKRLAKVKNELKSMEEARKKEATTSKEEEQRGRRRPQKTWWLDG
jgi:hypothetical protein